MPVFSLAISFDHFQFALIHIPNIPGSYEILLFTASDFTSITSHIHSCVLFFAWLHLFILTIVISLLISMGHLSTWGVHLSVSYLFHFHTVRGVLKARILKWFAIPFSSGPPFVRTLHPDPSIVGGPTRHGSLFHWVRQGCGPCDQIC